MNFNQDNNSTSIRFNPGREDKFSANTSDLGTRPTGDPKSSKNFQKIMRKGSDDRDRSKEAQASAIEEEGEEQGSIELAEAQALKKKQKPSSLFELSSFAARSSFAHEGKSSSSTADLVAKAEKTSNPMDTPEHVTEHVHTASPSELYAKLTAKESQKADDRFDHLADAAPHETSHLEEKKVQFNPLFASEQTDLSYVNPMALAAQPVQAITPLSTEKLVLPVTHIQDIINQLVEKVVQIETTGRTETVVTLKHPPVFAGAELVVTSFDSAKGEFNLTFQNLTQAAKAILDAQVNQQSLLTALEQKGYAVHIVTTTTLIETRLPIPESTPSQDRNRDPEQQRQQKQPEKQK